MFYGKENEVLPGKHVSLASLASASRPTFWIPPPPRYPSSVLSKKVQFNAAEHPCFTQKSLSFSAIFGKEHLTGVSIQQTGKHDLVCPHKLLALFPEIWKCHGNSVKLFMGFFRDLTWFICCLRAIHRQLENFRYVMKSQVSALDRLNLGNLPSDNKRKINFQEIHNRQHCFCYFRRV